MTGQTIVITADSPLSAVDRLLRELLPAARPSGRRRENFLLGYNVEGADIPVVIMRMIDEVDALAADHDAIVIGGDVSGLQQTDEGYRLWGTIECIPAGGKRHSTRVDGIRLERLSRLTWQLTATTILKEPS